MADHESASKTANDKTAQKHRVRQPDSQPQLGQYHGWDQAQSSPSETPFYPQMDEHAVFLASAPPGPPSINFIMHLQKTYGNSYVQRLVESMGVQAKLTVSQPDDAYEKEADRVAGTVTKALNHPAQRQEEEEEMPVQMKISYLQRQEIPEEEEVQAKQSEPLQRQEEEEMQAQLSAENIENRINRVRGSGESLPDTVKEPMEQAFGSDFSGVKIHTGSESDALNRELSAKAFTTGQDVFFRENEYSPGSESGRELLAHELTHVVQQSGNIIRRKGLKEEGIRDKDGSNRTLSGHDTSQSVSPAGKYVAPKSVGEITDVHSGHIVQRDVPTEAEVIASWDRAGVHPSFPPVWAQLMEVATDRSSMSWDLWQRVINNQSEAQRLFGRAVSQAWGQVRDRFLNYLIGRVATTTIGAVLTVLPAAQTIIDESRWRRDRFFRIEQIRNWLLRQLALICASAERTYQVTEWDSRVQAIFSMLVTQTANYEAWISGPEAREFRRRAAEARGGRPTIESL